MKAKLLQKRVSAPIEVTEKSHDYDPEWDYCLSEDVEMELKEAVIESVGELEIAAKKVGVPGLEVHYVDDLPDDIMAKYIAGTSTHPVIVLSPKNLLNASEEYGVDIHVTVETTLAHELGHALQEKCGLNTGNEHQAEEVARSWYDSRSFPLWVKKQFNV